MLFIMFGFIQNISFSQNVELNNNVESLFVENLRAVGFPVDEILLQKTISRYDVTRLLNAVECVDCLNPGQNQIDLYTEGFWDNFVIRPGEDFRDILFREAFYREGSYYYCVAYAADNEYMNGFPIATSPICSGVFCGIKDTTKAEFLQIIVNVIEKYTFQNYSINWSEVDERNKSLRSGSYADRYLNEFDYERIEEGLARCGTTICPLASRWEFKTYRKYCMFELEKCNNRTFGFLQAGRWPIAELNILFKENIINEENIQDTIHDPVDGEYVLGTFGRLFPIIRCKFDTDYDCDNITNHLDSCPNSYNPQQRDLDNDGVGNVCDDDIDGDGITNPIGIVDDNDNIIISKYESDMDNCLFTVNPNQEDRNDDKIGDACDGSDEFISLWIESKIQEKDGVFTVGFFARTDGRFSSIDRDLGDGNFDNGEQIVHTYKTPGVYTVIAKAKGLRNDGIAKTTIVIGKQGQSSYAMIAKPDILQGPVPLTLKHTQDIVAETNNLKTEVLINQEVDKTIGSNQTFSKNFAEPGIYTINVSLKDNENIVAVSQYNIGVGNSAIGSSIQTEQILYDINEEVQLITNIEGDTDLNPVQEIEWNFGDGEIIKTNAFDYKKTYEKSGRKVVIQNILFEDGSIQQNFATIFINDPKEDRKNQNISLSVDPGFVQAEEESKFEIIEYEVNQENIIKKIINFDDEQSEDLESNSTRHSYTQGGIYFPQASYYMNECVSLHSQATIVVNKPNLCLQAKINNTLDQYKCDLDEDGIPDICDDDIDGDGITNQIGLIKFENENCNYIGNIDVNLLNSHVEGVCLLDNCPFLSNSDQLDLNNDGIGDECPELIDTTQSNLSPSEKDTDGDGYTDDRDACPELPENFNGVEDGDGCPEIGENDPCLGNINLEPFITAVNCNSCPCHFADFGDTLQEGDKVRAILTDTPRTRDYTRSFPYIIQ